MVTATERRYKVHLRPTADHKIQDEFINCTADRIVIKAGRRGGKTVGIAKRAVKRFLKGRRQLYGAPTTEQVSAFWFEVCKALQEPIDAGVYHKNESEHTIEVPGTKQRIKAKTCWNAETLRGDYADDLYLDEYQLMNEDAWAVVGAPMLMDNNGSAVFIFTPPSLVTAGVSKAKDPMHATKLYNEHKDDTTGRWKCFHFSSFDNPYISKVALANITQDMSLKSYRQEILAEDDEIEQSWLVYGVFNSKTNYIPRFPIPNTWPRYTGHDFGGANPAMLLVAQDPATGFFYLDKEYAPGSRSTAQHVEAFLKMTDGLNVIKRIGGNPGEKGTEEETRQGYTAHKWPIQAPKLAHVKPMVDRVIGIMELNKFFIFNDLDGTYNQICNCMWVIDKQTNKPTNDIDHEERYHFLACLRYVLSEFAPETATATAPVTVKSFRRY